MQVCTQRYARAWLGPTLPLAMMSNDSIMIMQGRDTFVPTMIRILAGMCPRLSCQAQDCRLSGVASLTAVLHRTVRLKVGGSMV